jgi:hypothetical protein
MVQNRLDHMRRGAKPRFARIMNRMTEVVIERPTARPAMDASLLLKQAAK